MINCAVNKYMTTNTNFIDELSTCSQILQNNKNKNTNGMFRQMRHYLHHGLSHKVIKIANVIQIILISRVT